MNERNIALIPARAGSKRVKNKNIKLLNGKPLICYAIETALEAARQGVIERVIVSTDSLAIRRIALKCGAEAPFLRPKKLAQDHTPDLPVFNHLKQWLAEHDHYSFDNLIILRPTTPFKTVTMIQQAISKLRKNRRLSAVRSVTAVEGVFHPYWMYRSQNGTLTSFIKGIDVAKYFQSQLLPPCYRLNGVVDVLRTKFLGRTKDPYGHNIGYIEIDPRDAWDIDTPFDFEICELLMKKRHNRKKLV